VIAELASADAPVVQLLARIAQGDPGLVRDTAADAVGRSDSRTVAATVASVLPPGLFPGDERLEAVAEVVAAHDDTGQATALLTGRPSELG
jgi:hypothetical protein